MSLSTFSTYTVQVLCECFLANSSIYIPFFRVQLKVRKIKFCSENAHTHYRPNNNFAHRNTFLLIVISGVIFILLCMCNVYNS